MSLYQAIVWIDEVEARILRYVSGVEHQSTVKAERDAACVSEEPEDIAAYFERVARALDIADEILIVGPNGAKLEFSKFMHKNEHSIDPRILGVETIEEPLVGDIEAFAALYFARSTPRDVSVRRGNGGGNGS